MDVKRNDAVRPSPIEHDGQSKRVWINSGVDASEEEESRALSGMRLSTMDSPTERALNKRQKDSVVLIQN